MSTAKDNTEAQMQKVLARFKSIIKIVRESDQVLEQVTSGMFMKATVEIDEGMYQGETVAGIRQGGGRQIWSNREYIGQGYNNEISGFGRTKWRDGSSFTGFYRNFKKEGVGIYIWGDKNCYTGEWENDVMNGIGKYTYSDGREYFGEWKKGNMDGFGVFRWVDGRKYEGEWRNGKKHGVGITGYGSGKPVTNRWENGKIMD